MWEQLAQDNIYNVSELSKGVEYLSKWVRATKEHKTLPKKYIPQYK